MLLRPLLLVICCATGGHLVAQQAGPSQGIVERTATAHPIHYFVSLPQGWNAQRTWPVIVVIPDAEREFRECEHPAEPP